MKILLIHNYYQYWGGEDSYFASLIKLLKDNGHEVIVYTKNSKDIDGHNILQKIRIGIGMFWNVEVEKELTEIIKKFKPDVAQFQNVYPLIAPFTYKICKKFNIPIIQRVSNYRFMCPKGTVFRNGKICELCLDKSFSYPSVFYGCYHRSRLASVVFSLLFYFHTLNKTFDLIDRFIFPSEFIRNYYLKNTKIPKNKTIVIPTFIDMAKLKFKSQVKDKNYFLYVGRLSEEKGIIPLLKLFVSLPELKLIVIGLGPLENVVKTYSQYKNILIKGFMSKDKIYTYMKSAIATIMPSLWYDVLPNVLIESYACSTPVIAPKFGTFENLINNNTGHFYKYQDKTDLKKVIQRLRALNIKKKKMHKCQIKNKMLNMFGRNRHVAQLLKIYNISIKNA